MAARSWDGGARRPGLRARAGPLSTRSAWSTGPSVVVHQREGARPAALVGQQHGPRRAADRDAGDRRTAPAPASAARVASPSAAPPVLGLLLVTAGRRDGGCAAGRRPMETARRRGRRAPPGRSGFRHRFPAMPAGGRASPSSGQSSTVVARASRRGGLRVESRGSRVECRKLSVARRSSSSG